MTATAEPASLEPVNDTWERWYPYPPTGEKLDSVTYLIGATQHKPWFEVWHATSALGWALDNMDLFLEVLRTDGRKAAIDLGKDAAEQIRLIKAKTGTWVHQVVRALVLWADSPEGTGASVALPLLPDYLADALYDGEPLPDVAAFMVDGFVNFVAAFNPAILAAEMKVYNQPLGLAGTLDLIIELTGYAISAGTGKDGADEIIACPGNVLVICVDVKTGKDVDPTAREQLAAYRRMRECLVGLGELWPMPSTHAGAVLHLRPEHPGGYLLQLVSAHEDEPAWNRFLAMAAGHKDRQRAKGKPGPSFRPFRPDGTMPGPRLCDVRGDGENWSRALTPLGRALGGDAELENVAEFTYAELDAVPGIGPGLIKIIRTILGEHGLCLRDEHPDYLADLLRQSIERKAS